MENRPAPRERLVKPTTGDQYFPYGPQDSWMFQVDPDAVEAQGLRFGQAIKNGIVALRKEGKSVYAEDLGARGRPVPPDPPPTELTHEQWQNQFQAEFTAFPPAPTLSPNQRPAPVYEGLVDQYGNPVPTTPRQRATPPREIDFDPFDPQAAWAEEMRRAEARVRGEPEPQAMRYATEAAPPSYYATEADRYATESQPRPTQHTHPGSGVYTGQPIPPTPSVPEFLNADGTIPRRPCGATTVITLRNRDHVIECQEEVRDPGADHPHYGLPHLALLTTGKRGHRVFIGWHVEGEE